MKAQQSLSDSEYDASSESESHFISEPWVELLEIVRRGKLVDDYESLIVPSETVYLITWSPNPELLPDADFITQHQFNVNFLGEYLKTCLNGLICVESTQRGNPHYHGWYQVDPITELERISYVKTMEKFGLVKITAARTVKPGLWGSKKNGLHYYKKELIDSMLKVPSNPITPESYDTTDWSSYMFFFTRTFTDKTIDKKMSDRQYYLRFYCDSKE